MNTDDHKPKTQSHTRIAGASIKKTRSLAIILTSLILDTLMGLIVLVAIKALEFTGTLARLYLTVPDDIIKSLVYASIASITILILIKIVCHLASNIHLSAEKIYSEKGDDDFGENTEGFL